MKVSTLDEKNPIACRDEHLSVGFCILLAILQAVINSALDNDDNKVRRDRDTHVSHHPCNLMPMTNDMTS